MFLKRLASARSRRSRFQSFLLVGGLAIALAGGSCGPLFAATGDQGLPGLAGAAVHGQQPAHAPAGPHRCIGACDLGAMRNQAPVPCDAVAAFDRCPPPDVSAPVAAVIRIPVLGPDPALRSLYASWFWADALYLQFKRLLI